MISTCENNKEWYEEWFDSPFYHKLYKHRDYSEAKKFIDNLIHFLSPLQHSFFLDAACGKGRHSLYIAGLGFNVDGFDLSSNNINAAKKNESSKLKFFINDIRTPLNIGKYDYVLNLFTSFGYFNSFQENLKALNALALCLKPSGKLIIDFMNVNKVINNLKQSETVKIDETIFTIKRTLQENNIYKEISFNDNGKKFYFREVVEAIDYEGFVKLFAAANLKIDFTFGDYELNNFDKNISDRLIFVVSKK